MAILSLKFLFHYSLFLSLLFGFFLPLIYSLSTVAISETGNQTLVCAIAQNVNHSQESPSFINCTSFPRRVQIVLGPALRSVSGIVGGNGFLCALSSFYSSSTSIMVCWRFSDIGSNMTRKRIYTGPVLTNLDSGNSKICGLLDGSNALQCWQWRGFDHTNTALTSDLAVGDDFVCGLSSLGQVQCLGNDANVTGHVPMGNFRLLSAGFRHACAISLNGSLECWGNMAGEKPRGEFTALALGKNRGCALRSNRTVSCWGENEYNMPESLRNEFFISLEAKEAIFCGIKMSDYSLLCWGNEDFDLNPLVFNGIVPGPCRTRNQCSCGPLPNYGEYCDQGLMICQPCTPSVGLWPPLAETPPPPPSLVMEKTRKWNAKMVALMVFGCVGSFSLLLSLCSFLFFRYRRDRGSSRIHDSGHLEEGSSVPPSGQTAQAQPAAPELEKRLSQMMSLGNGGQLEEFPLHMILRVTENFSEDHKIGHGSFGSVYRATLEDGREVAFKRAETSASSSYANGATRRSVEDKDSAFLNELEFLSRLNHKNLVRLLGYCDDGDELVLVYEYMSNYSLYSHLHKLQSSPLTSWPKRIKVALDAARGLEYLHEFAVPRIIHRDIKSSNILIDARWTAKVSDFGLSLMGPPDDETHLLLRAAGTMGYMDPEYYRLEMLTSKSDVYSFGVVLLELLSGRKAIHKNENGVPRNVVDYVVPYIIHDEIHRILDPKMPAPTPFEIEAVAYVGYLAADCVMPEGRDRPTMTEVVNSLKRALEACLAPPLLSRSTTGSSMATKSE
ncbi:serine/threonine-protein kinase-like protein CCR4 [Primulina huaijiensis]|uniref:serine/threonine-protein kinase-like protein CCR4 n=1 Tax=Primulina huaijiensis TaxID=1492673 RepID=UPI003CC752F3